MRWKWKFNVDSSYFYWVSLGLMGLISFHWVQSSRIELHCVSLHFHGLYAIFIGLYLVLLGFFFMGFSWVVFWQNRLILLGPTGWTGFSALSALASGSISKIARAAIRPYLHSRVSRIFIGPPAPVGGRRFVPPQATAGGTLSLFLEKGNKYNNDWKMNK